MEAIAQQSSGVQVVRCDHCGASIPIIHLVPRVWCTSCGTPHSLEQEWIAGAGAYARQVSRLLEIAEHNQENIAVAQASGVLFIRVLAGFGCALLGVSILVVAAQRSQADFQLLFYPVCFGWAASAWFVRAAPDKLARWRHRRRKNGTRGPAKEVRCPSCGAANATAVGTAAEACAYCGASLAVAIQQMWVAAWRLALDVRAAAARARVPSRFKYKGRDMLSVIRWLGTEFVRWEYLWHLAQAVGGQAGLEHAPRWLRGYWTDATPDFFAAQGGGFVWGHWRGYPVALLVLKLRKTPVASGSGRMPQLSLRTLGPGPGSMQEAHAWVAVFVSAVSSPARSVRTDQRADIFQTTAGYMSTARLAWNEATPNRLLEQIEQLCLVALRDEAPPAPFIEH
jgi:ribosomal protein S26